MAYLPYLGGAADERQFKVMRDREQWFQVVMGQQAVEQLITAESAERSHALPRAVTESLAFDLSIAKDDASRSRRDDDGSHGRRITGEGGWASASIEKG